MIRCSLMALRATYFLSVIYGDPVRSVELSLLCRLRGVGYTTPDWAGGALLTSHPVPGGYQGPAHKKFANYEFDPAEFVRVMHKIREKVLSNPLYRENSHDRDEL